MCGAATLMPRVLAWSVCFHTQHLSHLSLGIARCPHLLFLNLQTSLSTSYPTHTHTYSSLPPTTLPSWVSSTMLGRLWMASPKRQRNISALPLRRFGSRRTSLDRSSSHPLPPRRGSISMPSDKKQERRSVQSRERPGSAQMSSVKTRASGFESIRERLPVSSHASSPLQSPSALRTWA
jgi:hypothetical protein